MVTIQLMNRKYYVREGHTNEQIVKSLVKQINDDKEQICNAKQVGKDGFVTTCPIAFGEYELRFD